MEKFRRGLRCILFVAFFTVFLYYSSILQEYLRIQGQKNPNYYPYEGFLLIFPILVGIIIGGVSIKYKSKIRGPWKFDWIKFCTITIPTFLMAMLPLIYFNTPIRYLALGAIFQNKTFFLVNGILCGFSILNNFDKIKNCNE